MSGDLAPIGDRPTTTGSETTGLATTGLPTTGPATTGPAGVPGAGGPVTDGPASADHLPYGPTMSRLLPMLHSAFLAFNRWFAVPLIRAGLSPAWGTPYGGYFVLLRTRGRRSGKTREAPLGYGIVDGDVYVMAGFGPATQWLRNVRADPRVEVVLPGRSFGGMAAEVGDPAERARGMRAAAIGCGLLGALILGTDPRRASDDELLRLTEGIPLVRIRSTGIAAGPWDPGGHGWVVVHAIAGLLLWRWWRGRPGPRRAR